MEPSSSNSTTATNSGTPYNSDLSEEISEPLNKQKKSSTSIVKRFHFISENKPPTKNPAGFVSSILGICCVIPVAGCGLCIALAVFGIVNCIPIATIVIGALYLDKEFCPPENIAIILIVGGSLTLVQSVMEGASKIIQTLRDEANKKEMPACLGLIYTLARLASFAWFIAACVIVYRLHSDVNFDDPTSDTYCHPTLYIFSFWLLTTCWIVLALVFTCICCGCLCAICNK